MGAWQQPSLKMAYESPEEMIQKQTFKVVKRFINDFLDEETMQELIETVAPYVADGTIDPEQPAIPEELHKPIIQAKLKATEINMTKYLKVNWDLKGRNVKNAYFTELIKSCMEPDQEDNYRLWLTEALKNPVSKTVKRTLSEPQINRKKFFKKPKTMDDSQLPFYKGYENQWDSYPSLVKD